MLEVKAVDRLDGLREFLSTFCYITEFASSLSRKERFNTEQLIHLRGAYCRPGWIE